MYGGGAWIDGATITLTGPVSRTMTADGTGFYAFIDLPPGVYSLTCNATNYGSTVYVSVKAGNGAGQWGSVGTSNGIRMATSVGSVVAAKGQTDAVIRITGRTVSAVYDNCFYVQDPTVKSGIRCEGVCPYAVGTTVDVGGELFTTAAKERTLADAEVTLSP